MKNLSSHLSSENKLPYPVTVLKLSQTLFNLAHSPTHTLTTTTTRAIYHIFCNYKKSENHLSNSRHITDFSMNVLYETSH